jgi:glycosyltransferase involved in cell wall biosynthesis
MSDRPFPASDQSVSIVVPLFNEEHVLPELLRRLHALLDRLPPGSEAILVDDGSYDATPQLIQSAASSDSRIRGIRLSRNFGHQAAVSAGLLETCGAAVAVIDGDLQDPPELILDMLKRLSQGTEVVFAVRRRRKERVLKRISYWIYYRLLKLLAGISIPPDSGDFAVMSRRVAVLLADMPERTRFLRGMRAWVGFKQEPFEYDRPGRAAGETKYSLRKLMRLAFSGILAFSDLPLRLAFAVGMGVTGLALVYLLFLVTWRIITGSVVPGFATVAGAIFFFGGLQITLIGLIGLYVGRIYEEVKQRPHFIVERRFGDSRGA